MTTFELARRHDNEQDRDETALSPTTKYLGLCSTCKNASTCTYPRDPNRPISSCCEEEGYEECEGSVSIALLRAGSIFPHPPESTARSPATERDSRAEKGLCSNCAKRETCTFPRPDGGVWRCEEYE